MNAPLWFVAANAVVLVVSSTVAGVLFYRLQRHWRIKAMMRELQG